MNRREWMTALTLAACGVRSSQAQPVAHLRLGVDGLLFDTGLAAKWKAAMGRDVGLGVEWVRSTTAEVLAGLDSGSMQAGLFFSGPQADTLSRQGLKRIYIVTLTLALSMALLVAIALAVLLANRLSEPLGTLESLKTLVKDGFKVLVYCSDDVMLCKRLKEAGAAAIEGTPSWKGRGGYE